MTITYGNREGQYFTEWRFELLAELLELVEKGPATYCEPLVVENPEIWYDAYHDFHMLRFSCAGRVVEARFYKVFSTTIDGKEDWIGCPRSNICNLAVNLRKKLGVVVPTFYGEKW